MLLDRSRTVPRYARRSRRRLANLVPPCGFMNSRFTVVKVIGQMRVGNFDSLQVMMEVIPPPVLPLPMQSTSTALAWLLLRLLGLLSRFCNVPLALV